MSLTDLQIKKLKAPESGQRTYYDDALPGFGVRVSQGGTKTFVVIVGKRRQRKSIGRYPYISLSDARREAKRIQSDLSIVSGQLTLPTANVTFTDAREQFLRSSKARNKPSTYGEYRRLLHRYFPFTCKLVAITRRHIMGAVEAVRGPSEAKHAFVAIRTMMNWCVRQGLLESTPVPPIGVKATSRSRVLSDEELLAVWRRAQEIGYPYGTLVQLLILTGQRRGEVANLRWDWITDDLIVFPASITKNGREHRLPIAPQTQALLASVPRTADLVFPSRHDPEKPINGWSKCKRQFDSVLPFADYTLHDLRRTFASNLARLGTPIHVTEKILNHVSGTVSGVAAVYNRYSYEDEMRMAIEALGAAVIDTHTDTP